jgi:hypothetical protein
MPTSLRWQSLLLVTVAVIALWGASAYSQADAPTGPGLPNP